MKYSELISFSPIESTIQLKESNRTAAESARLVKTYVMSDAMAQNLQAPVIDQLQMDEVVDNKGVLVIGNYGTGKSHLMFGMTAENLKDELCLYLPMPEQDADFLLGIISATLRDIISTVSGQFIVHNEGNNQYYIDVNQTVNYDEKIRQRAQLSLLDNDELNRYFYQVTYSCLEWEKKQYVSGFNIYEHDLNWISHNIFREGYLFMGLPGERSTAQPERDFYIHIMPPYGTASGAAQNMDDEVYFYFKSTDEFKELLSLYAGAQALANISDGNDKDAYLQKAGLLRKKLVT